jgi:hypothetical protein
MASTSSNLAHLARELQKPEAEIMAMAFEQHEAMIEDLAWARGD